MLDIVMQGAWLSYIQYKNQADFFRQSRIGKETADYSQAPLHISPLSVFLMNIDLSLVAEFVAKKKMVK
jgi:hypothetical protein